MCLIQGIALLTFWFVGKSVPGFYIWATVIGFNFGGNFALYPSITADFFGNKNVGVNYGWMFTAYGVGGIVGPILTAHFKDLVATATDITVKYHSWLTPFLICGIICIVAAVVITLIQKPVKAEAAPALMAILQKCIFQTPILSRDGVFYGDLSF